MPVTLMRPAGGSRSRSPSPLEDHDRARDHLNLGASAVALAAGLRIRVRCRELQKPLGSEAPAWKHERPVLVVGVEQDQERGILNRLAAGPRQAKLTAVEEHSEDVLAALP